MNEAAKIVSSGWKQKFDGWINVLTGLGMKGKDKAVAAGYEYSRFTEMDAEVLYACDDMAAKIVDILPAEMTREGFEVKTDDGEFPDLETDLKNYLDEHDVISKLREALEWGRLYGGAGMVLGIRDGQDASLPIAWDKIQSIDFISNMTRWELHRQEIQQNPMVKDFGLPERYQLQPSTGGANMMIVHKSRVIRFDGAKLPRRLFIQNDYWHDSILNRILAPLRNFQQTHGAVANLLQDFAQAVYKIKNLTEMIAMGKDDLVEKRLALVDRTRSIVNAIVIEDGEEFDRKVTSLTGVPETMAMLNKRLVQATNIPHTILLGESPSGLGATGNSEKNDWYDHVAAQQETELKPQLTYLLKAILCSKDGPTGGVEPENWRIEFKPLYQLSQKEIVETRKIQSDIDKTYIESGVIGAEEVALSRFGGDEFSYETKLITDPMERAEENKEAEADAAAMQAAALEADPEEDPEDDERMDFILYDLMIEDGGPGSGPQGGSSSPTEGASKEQKAAFKSADKKVESTGKAFDKNPSKENEAKLSKALQEREVVVNAIKASKSIPEIESKLKELGSRKAELQAASTASKARIAELKAKLAAYKK